MFLDRFACKPVIIGEVGVNHNGDYATADLMLMMLSLLKVDIAKFQIFKAHECASKLTSLADYQKNSKPGQLTSQYDLLKKLELPFPKFVKLKKRTESLGMTFLATPDGIESLEFLVKMGISAMKIASGEITNLPFLAQIASKKLPIILSTGMSTLEEVSKAIETLKANGSDDIMLMHCTTEYPATPEGVNLKCIQTMKDAFGLPVGLSDHTKGYEAAVIATALGADLIEKHFTLNCQLPGPDHRASLDPGQMFKMIEAINKTKTMLGSGIKEPSIEEIKNIPLVRRSLVAARDIEKGTILNAEDIAIKRPETGIKPEFFSDITGRKLSEGLKKDEPITWQKLTKQQT